MPVVSCCLCSPGALTLATHPHAPLQLIRGFSHNLVNKRRAHLALSASMGLAVTQPPAEQAPTQSALIVTGDSGSVDTGADVGQVQHPLVIEQGPVDAATLAAIRAPSHSADDAASLHGSHASSDSSGSRSSTHSGMDSLHSSPTHSKELSPSCHSDTVSEAKHSLEDDDHTMQAASPKPAPAAVGPQFKATPVEGKQNADQHVKSAYAESAPSESAPVKLAPAEGGDLLALLLAMQAEQTAAAGDDTQGQEQLQQAQQQAATRERQVPAGGQHVRGGMVLDDERLADHVLNLIIAGMSSYDEPECC